MASAHRISHVGVSCLLVSQASSITSPRKATASLRTTDCPRFHMVLSWILHPSITQYLCCLPLPQKARWQNICDSITETPLPLQSSLLPTQTFFSILALLESCLGVIRISMSSGLICNGCQATTSDPESKYTKRLFQEGKGDLENRHHFLISFSTVLPSSHPLLLLKVLPQLGLSSE